MDVSCTPINYLTTPEMKEVVMVTYLYYMLKVSDLLDTVNSFSFSLTLADNICSFPLAILCFTKEE